MSGNNPDSIMSMVEYLVEEGDLPEGTEREVFDELYENTADCEQCGRGPLTYPAWQGVPEHPVCASCALSTTTEV